MLWSSQWDIFVLDSLLKKLRWGKAKAKIIFHSYVVFTLFGILNLFLYILFCFWHHFSSVRKASFCTCYSVYLLTMDYVSFAYLKRSIFCLHFWKLFFDYRFQSREILFFVQHSTCLSYCCWCLVAELCLTCLQPHGPPRSSIHGISWVGCHFLLQGIFPTQGMNPCLLLGRWILYHWAIWEAHVCLIGCIISQSEEYIIYYVGKQL